MLLASTNAKKANFEYPEAIAKVQSEISGVWYRVLDKEKTDK